MKRCSILLTLRKYIFKVWYYYILTRLAKIKNWQYLALPRVWNNWLSHTWLAGMQNGISTLENGLAVSNKVNHILSTKTQQWYYFRGMKNYIQTKDCTHMFISVLDVIAKSWQLPKCLSTGEWIKQTVVYLYNKIQLGSKNKPTTDSHNDLN